MFNTEIIGNYFAELEVKRSNRICIHIWRINKKHWWKKTAECKYMDVEFVDRLPHEIDEEFTSRAMREAEDIIKQVDKLDKKLSTSSSVTDRLKD